METLAGHRIFYIDEGEQNQETILLIHGFPTSSWDWQALWPKLGKERRLVCLDLLGFGFSDKPNYRRYTIHQQADIVEALVRHLKLKTFHVLAHDYGDTVTQELLARQNEGAGAGQWLSCCLLNGGLFPETHKALMIQKLLLSPLGPAISSLMKKPQFDRSFSQVFGKETQPSKQELEQFWFLINHNGGKHLFHNLITYMHDRILHRKRWVGALQDAKMPLALINGSVDPVSGAHMVARYKALQCRLDYLAELPNIGHYPQVESPENVLHHYLTFLPQQLSDTA